jgi:transcriptional regulator
LKAKEDLRLVFEIPVKLQIDIDKGADINEVWKEIRDNLGLEVTIGSWYIIADSRELSFREFMKRLIEAKSKASIVTKGERGVY